MRKSIIESVAIEKFNADHFNIGTKMPPKSVKSDGSTRSKQIGQKPNIKANKKADEKSNNFTDKRSQKAPSITNEKEREKLPEKPEEFAELIHDILRNRFEMCTANELMDYLNKRFEPPVDKKIIRKIINDEFLKGCIAIRPVK